MPFGGSDVAHRSNDDEYADYGRPREAHGGIKAQSRRGDFGQNWWAQRWIDVLDGFDIGSRVARARSYARRGQVLTIEIGNGQVTARVQGSEPQPYRVLIRVAVLDRADWRGVATTLGERPVFAANLIAGRMPDRIEEVFADAGLSLFPTTDADLHTACSCPDWTNPCKHIAAVYLLLGEEFDRDPFLLFRLRGMDRDELLTLAGLHIAQAGAVVSPATVAAEPLPSDTGAFWGPPDDPAQEAPHSAARIPVANAVIARRLGNFPFWQGEVAFLPTMETIYGKAAAAGLAALVGEDG